MSLLVSGWSNNSERTETMAYRSKFDPHDELSALCTELWELDENRLTPGKDYAIDLQGYTRSRSRVDRARDPLFVFVSEEALKLPTYKAFISLLDNYETSTGISEEVTTEEIRENRNFIDQIMETKVMKKCHSFLVSKGKAKSDRMDFKRQLYDLWFKLYRRTRGSSVLDSSGFEHVFVGETRNRTEVIGFHNWIQFYLQEKAGNIDYQGYIGGRKSDMGPDSRLITIQFKWNREVKPVGSTFVGTSPEFEVALYTILFLCSPVQTTDLTIKDIDVVVTCYKHGVNLGTSFPKDASS